MIKKIAACLIILTLTACQSKENVLSEQVSASGLPYTFTHMPGNSRVSIYIAWPTNWYFDGGNNPTVPIIGTRLLLSGGATDYPAGQVVERFTDMNSEGDLWPQADYVYGVLHFSPEHQDESIKIANAHLKSPLFDQQWLERIRSQFAEQTAELAGRAEVQGYLAASWAIFGKQAIRAGLIVREDTAIQTATQEELASWAKTVFKRQGALISIAGDLTVTDAGRAVDAFFEGLPEGDETPAGIAQLDMSPKRILLHTPESTTSTLTFFGKLPLGKEGLEFNDRILVDALSGGVEDGLSGAVRTELRASYNYDAGIEEYTRNNRLLIMSGQIETSQVAEAEKTILEAYAAFRANPSLEELPKVKKNFEVDFKENLKDTGSVAYDSMFLKLRGMDPARALNLADELDAITIQTLEQRLQDAFPKADEFLVVLSSPDEKALPDACVITVAEDALGC